MQSGRHPHLGVGEVAAQVPLEHLGELGEGDSLGRVPVEDLPGQLGGKLRVVAQLAPLHVICHRLRERCEYAQTRQGDEEIRRRPFSRRPPPRTHPRRSAACAWG